jgi:hypothetical protein
MPNHRIIDARSLAFGREIAALLSARPELIDTAKANLARWTRTATPRSLPALREWEDALDGPLEGIIALLTSDDERATRLRQSNPFAGVLPAEVRNRIIREFQAHDAAGA